MDNIYKAVQLTIDSQNLALSKTPTHVYIANQYVDTNDTPLITAPFIIQKALENGTGVVDIVSSTIGSIYEVRLLCDADVLISGYFYMPPMNAKFSELELYTSYPPRTPPVVNEFWQKTENFILEKTNTLLNFVQVFNSLSSMRLSLGYLEELLTTKKSNLVSAINEVVSVKADKATTLVGYGISDAYTKSEIDTNYGGVKTLYDKNVEAGAGENGWTADLVLDKSEATQQQVNYNGGSKWHSRVGGYLKNERAVLANGDIVKSTIDGNTNNPNVDMTGWKNPQASEIFDASGASQQDVNLRTVTPYTFHADGVGVNRPVSDWTVIGSKPYYQDLAAIQVDYPHVTSLTDSIDWAAFQKFLNYIKVNKCNAVAFGDFFINKPLDFLRNREPYTRVINGDITLKTTSAMPYMMRLTGLFTKWIGYINLQAEATGSLDYQLRKVEHGLILGGFEEGYTSLGISVDEVRVHGVKQLGVFCREWSMFAKIGSVRTSACGFGAKPNSTRQYANWSDRINNDLDTFSQRSTIKVDILPPKLDSDSTILVANINNEPYKIESIDEVNKTISVFPKIDTTLTSGQLYYVGGGAFGVNGANSNCVKVDLLAAVSSGIGCYNRSFYDLQISRLVSEANGIGYAHGKIATQIIITVVISNYYNETDSWLDILNASRLTTGANINIVSSSGLSEDRFKNVIAYRKSDNTLEGLYSGVGLSSININSRTKTYLKLPDNKTEATVTEYAFEVCDPRQHIYRKNSWVFNLSCTEKLNRLYGWDSTTIELIGTGTNNKPTGDFIFNPPGGWTVNSLPSVTLRSNTSSLRLSLYANFATKNIAIVSNQAVSATKTFDPPSLNANATITLTTVTLTGATVGANVNVSFSQPLGVSARIWGEVTAANTVTIYLQNLTAAALDLVSGDITVKLI